MEEIKTVIDNTKDWYDLADTALKIGLGALIAGGFTYITTKANHSHENKKNQYELKKQLILETSELSSKYFLKMNHIFYFWSSPIIRNKFIKDLQPSLIEKYKSYNDIYHTRIEIIEKINANLSLLGLEYLFDKLLSYDNQIKEIKFKIFSNEIVFPDDNEIFMIQVDNIKKEYNQKLSKYFLELK